MVVQVSSRCRGCGVCGRHLLLVLLDVAIGLLEVLYLAAWLFLCLALFLELMFEASRIAQGGAPSVQFAQVPQIGEIDQLHV